MATVGEFLGRLGRVVPFDKAAGWDPVGLQIGDRGAEAGAVAVCHDVTDQVVARVEEAAVDLLVAYHPLLFHPIDTLVSGPSAAGRAWRLARAGVSLIVAHTAFDVAPGGTADALAGSLGIEHTVPFGPLWGSESVKIVTFAPPGNTEAVVEAMARAGAGIIGSYSHCSFRTEGVGTFVPGPGSTPAVGTMGVRSAVGETRIEMVAPRQATDAVVAALKAAHPYEEPAYDVMQRSGEAGFVGRVGSVDLDFGRLVDLVGSRLDGSLRVSGRGPDGPVRVAVVPGSGSGFLTAAHRAGANVLVTGDVKHHDARRAADLGIAVIDPGHAATEKPGVARLYAAVAGEAAQALDLTGVDSDPWGPGMAGPMWKN